MYIFKKMLKKNLLTLLLISLNNLKAIVVFNEDNNDLYLWTRLTEADKKREPKPDVTLKPGEFTKYDKSTTGGYNSIIYAFDIKDKPIFELNKNIYGITEEQLESPLSVLFLNPKEAYVTDYSVLENYEYLEKLLKKMGDKIRHAGDGAGAGPGSGAVE